MLSAYPIHNQHAILDKWLDNDNEVKCYKLEFIFDELQYVHKDMLSANNLFTHLQQLWGDQSRTVHEMRDGQFVHDHYLIMIKDIEKLKKLDITMHKELLVDLIMQSLLVSYGSFVKLPYEYSL